MYNEKADEIMILFEWTDVRESSHRLQHADEGEDAQQRVPASQRQAKVERLCLLCHNVRAGGDESNVGKHNADDKRPIVGREVDGDGGHEVALDGKGQKAGGRHEVVGEVGHEGRHTIECVDV